MTQWLNEKIAQWESAMTEQTELRTQFFCDLASMNAEQRARYRDVTQQMRAATPVIEELADGYALRFGMDSSLCLVVAEFITLERLCCPFLDLMLEVAREGGPMQLKLTGSEGVKQFLRMELGL
jgi:hypothetical protein